MNKQESIFMQTFFLFPFFSPLLDYLCIKLIPLFYYPLVLFYFYLIMKSFEEAGLDHDE